MPATMPAMPTAALVVTAAVDGTFVRYAIQPSSCDRTEIKTARFSELKDLHNRLAAEAPSFPGRMPSRTLMRHMQPAFVENRRKDIEVYLRLVATHEQASASQAWKSFIASGLSAALMLSELSGEPAPDSAAGSPDEACGAPHRSATRGAAPLPGEESEGEEMEFGSTLNSEMGALIASKRDELEVLKKAKIELEEKTGEAEHAVMAVEAESKEQAGLEAEAAGCLKYHISTLEGLGTKVAAKRFACSDTERQQNELSKRLQEKLTSASEQATKSQATFEEARRTSLEAAAKTHSKVNAAWDKQLAAETANAAAIEIHAAMSAAMHLLQERAAKSQDEVKASEREVATITIAKDKVGKELSEAEAHRRSEESEATAAAAAVARHTSDATRRNRAHEVEIRRAEEKVANFVALRDMRTRGLLKGEDRSNCEDAEATAVAAAEGADNALRKAKNLHEDTQQSDAAELKQLEVAAARACKNLRTRETVVASRKARVQEMESQLHKVKAKQGTVEAASKALQQELESMKKRVEGPLSKALPQCAQRLQDASRAVEDAKFQGEQEQAPLRHAEEAEAQLLKSHQAAEAWLVQALDEAQMAAAEAHEETVVPTEDKSAAQESDFLVKSSESRLADREKQGKEAQDAYKAAVAAADAAQEEFAGAQAADEAAKQDADSDSDAEADPDSLEAELAAFEAELSIAERKATMESLEVRANDLQHVADEKKKASFAATSALKAAADEVIALKKSQKETREAAAPARPIEAMMREELTISNKGLQLRRDKEGLILQEAQLKMAEWLQEKESLGADLHRTELEVAVAKQNVQATKDLAKTISKGGA